MMGTAVKKKEVSAEYAANREKVIKDIQNLKNWWFLETENYIIASNLKNKKTISELQLNIEKCRSVYKKYYPKRNSVIAVCVCKVFEPEKSICHTSETNSNGPAAYGCQTKKNS